MSTPPFAAPVTPIAIERLAYRPASIDQISITSGTWATWQNDNRDVTIPHSFDWLEKDGTVDNLRRLDPESTSDVARRGLWFTDSDLYKALEGVAWEVARKPSAPLGALIDDITAIIAAAQEPDGYINSFVQAGLDVRWDNLVKSHELYCIGHLIQAGIAHRRATGASRLFDVAVRAADVAVRDFGDMRRGDTDGHEEIEMALVELYRETGKDEYLRLAKQFVDVRGHGVLDPKGHGDSDYYQDATPVRAETTVTGHAVRAVYLLAGVVDVYLETGERALLDAALVQWSAMTARKTYLTGGIGSRFVGEAFGEDFELPPDLAYGETCATIGNLMLSWRLLLATGESRFADSIERGLYNMLAASTSVDRTGFFYNNPVQRRRALPASVHGERPTRADAPGTRPEWFECACCPPNIIRTIASLSSYIATRNATGIQVHQFIPSTIDLALEDGRAVLAVETDYPLDGEVKVLVHVTPHTAWSLSLRKPDWAETVDLLVNGDAVDAIADSHGYVSVTRVWGVDDEVSYRIPLAPRLTVAHPAADALRGAVAIERGPVLYALESPDQPEGVDLNRVEIDPAVPITEETREDFLGQRSVILGFAGHARDDSSWHRAGWQSYDRVSPSPTTEVALTAIPYALWANRGPSTMRVFIPIHTATHV